MKAPHERRTALTHLVEAEGVARVNPPMLLEAAQYFELAGEEFGRSLLMTVANDGIEYCLRPEFTIPIVSQYVTQGLAGSPVAYGYMGPVFRQDPSGPHEYVQAGVELLGQLDPEQALDEVLTFARRALSVYRLTTPRIRLGGVGLFEAILAHAEMPDVWRPRIRARFGHKDAMSRLLDRLAEAHAGKPDAPSDPIDPESLTEFVAEQMLQAGFNPADGRHPEEVAERYHEKQALAAAHVPLPTIDLLRLYLSIEGRAATVLDEIEDLASVYKFDLSAPLAALRHHGATLKALAPQSVVTFDASFSPRLEYYTGIVFEMLSDSGAVLATGGQYDRLLQRLGASVPVTAAGCAVWVDRVEQEMAI
ncbi:MAG: ATP phosphoribosyltransferase regulatory subunit [Devosia sp.]|jgi:ATP phosphoribosyltransferase regulatory subunit|nr:ATP phosphoribosyltransferase regulatory subunit [Devosiaceae bacterium]